MKKTTINTYIVFFLVDMGYEAYLMVEFNCKTKLPVSIDVYSEGQDSITMIGNEYICVKSIDCSEEKSDPFHVLSVKLLQELNDGVYDSCVITFQGRNWSVKECKAKCAKYSK